jgi:sulfide:quinone oxidoreductase
MARVVILGAGISGHTAALHLRRMLDKEHEVMVVSPNSQWNWIPSNIWVGVGKMTVKDVTFPLAPVYRRKGVTYRQAKAVAVWPEGDRDDARPGVDVVHTSRERQGETGRQPRLIVSHDSHVVWKIRPVMMSPMIGSAIGTPRAMKAVLTMIPPLT